MPHGYSYFVESICIIILLFSCMDQLPAEHEHIISNHF